MDRCAGYIAVFFKIRGLREDILAVNDIVMAILERTFLKWESKGGKFVKIVNQKRDPVKERKTAN